MNVGMPGDYIRYRMSCSRLRLKDVAAELNVSVGTVSGWIHDKNFPDKPHLRELSQLLGVSEHEIKAGRDLNERSIFS